MKEQRQEQRKGWKREIEGVEEERRETSIASSAGDSRQAPPAPRG